ncbi:hypothetical protein AGABI1DRAFT_93622 [Agaricus bisporus var. burnettii JB137-S8]|uniref:BTB domain-containing protein n=1 Tax=Agaricus bisporus var. burnettii (strain JB137-S8 / ATCC MYA-4627 / FGSC 10392) TaxID=597362 RepID=K5VS18_AGABU|nr:uncharacterized protein AGABI1DRAFT_93622 [Agaricus bisporus var. burnettii JB137-S8]EKM77254.1 hypothetical protein AGABI1DRAFT_93622 [Agaricus bisporus var. burnettii JB137-S8]
MADVPFFYDDSHLINGFDPLSDTLLNFDDVLLPNSLAGPPEPELPLLPTPVCVSSTPFSQKYSGNASATSKSPETEDRVVSISTSFNLTSHSVTPDLIFSTFDEVLFYAHSQVLKAVSPKAFGQIIGGQNENLANPGSEVIHQIPDSSAVFNVILHTLYGTSPAKNSPTFETLLVAVDRMRFYDMNTKDLITIHTPLHQLLLIYAPLYPLHLYSLAARHELEDLAVSSSSHLLSFPLLTLPDEMAIRMGAIYLKRLFCLHLSRMTALKEILLVSPHPHPPTKDCDFTEQKALTRAWALVSAYLAWDARADLSTASLRTAFEPLIEKLSCELCRSELRKRIKEVISQWAAVKPTI